MCGVSGRFPILTTDRLLLRVPTEADLPAYAPIFADPRVMQYIGDGSLRTPDRVAQSVQRCNDLFERTGTGLLLVTDRQTGEMYGDCFVVPILHSGRDPNDPASRGPERELGYRLKFDAWGRGYATEAARAVLEHALDPAGGGLEEVLAVTVPENKASQRVLLKIGMEAAGRTDRFYGMETALFVGRKTK